MKFKRYKGTKDYFGEDLIKRESLRKKIEKILINYNYNRYETPLLEKKELFSIKTEDSLLETRSFLLKDSGDRELILRPEITPSLARMLNDNYPILKLPLRLYNFGNMYRFENPQKGRLREFMQYNVDFAYNNREMALLETFDLLNEILKNISVDAEILVNNRLWMEEIIKTQQWGSVEVILDILDNYKKKNLDLTKVSNRTSFETFLNISSWQEFQDWIISNMEEDCSFYEELLLWKEELSSLNVKFSPWIVRGLNYYTGFVFEVFAKDESKISRALGGGGEYDLVNLLGENSLPMVGFALGEVPLMEIFTEVGDIAPADIFLASDNPLRDYRSLNNLRKKLIKEGYNVYLFDKKIKIKKVLKRVNEMKIKLVYYIGEREREKNSVLCKNMETGEQVFLEIN